MQIDHEQKEQGAKEERRFEWACSCDRLSRMVIEFGGKIRGHEENSDARRFSSSTVDTISSFQTLTIERSILLGVKPNKTWHNARQQQQWT
jgi:hypothetical protein